MFAAFIRLRKTHQQQPRPYRIPGGKTSAWIVTGVGMFSVLLAIILPFIVPPSDISSTHDVLMYRLELIMGAVVFGIIGYLIYIHYEKKKADNKV